MDTGPMPHFELESFRERFPSEVIFLDLETCGFAGSMIFLVGLLHHGPNGLVLTQLLARDYAEERSILEGLWTLVAAHRVLVTFNGKSFDWPQVHDRSTVYRLGRTWRGPLPTDSRRSRPCADVEIESTAARSDLNLAVSATPLPFLGRDDPRPEMVHFDLLHHARRRWGRRLPNCKLQTLELYVCGRRRTGDIPGHAIPAVYHEYVRDGDPAALDSILHHNALDLVTLLQLSVQIFSHETDS